MSTDVSPISGDEARWHDSAQIEPYRAQGTAFVAPTAESHTLVYDPPQPARHETAAAATHDRDGALPAEQAVPAEHALPAERAIDGEHVDRRAPDTPASDTAAPCPVALVVPAQDPTAVPAVDAAADEPTTVPTDEGPSLTVAPVGADADAAPRARRSGTRRPVAVAAALLAAALVGGAAGAGVVVAVDRGRRTVDAGLTITTVTGPPAPALDGTVAAAAAKLLPSAVAVDVGAGATASNGSGIIIRSDGYVLTADHVIAPAPGRITVVLSDGRAASATVVGRDAIDDVAVLRVRGVGALTAATFADPTSLAAGQAVVSVDAGGGLTGSVRSGSVSALQRAVHTHRGSVVSAIQTTMPVGPGGSGAPMADLSGVVVGVSTDTAEPPVAGVGFAIPSGQAARIAGELITSGRVTRATLGATVADVPLLDGPGAVVTAVSPGGPAAKAGLKVGDVISQLGDFEITNADGVLAAVGDAVPGQHLVLRYARRNTAATATVVTGRAKN